MCGIAGKLIFDPSAQVEQTEIETMLGTLRHRGPDGEGVYLSANVGLGHCRLAIIDLDTGAQPMTNEDGSIWITFNGEIYNFQELREQLRNEGHIFKTRSDTEVIIHLYEKLGPDCVRELRGMFALAIWDARKRLLFLARDRVGIKPLYYLQTSDAFYFASELKAIIADASIRREINLPAVRKFLAFNYLPGAETLLAGIRKLLPGHYLLVKDGKVRQRRYWDLDFTRARWPVSFETATEQLHDLIQSTVRLHMIADVPVGILLSGGVDSSAVLSFAANGSGRKIKTFTVGFDDGEIIDERIYARIAAKHFHADHYETTISADDFWNFLPVYVQHMEEPVCEPPAVALFYVSKLASNLVKVLLSGEGGDEAFAGYPNYPNMLRLEKIRNIIGPFSRMFGATATFLGAISGDDRWQRYGYALGRPLSAHYFSRTSSPTSFFNRKLNFFSREFREDTIHFSPAEPVSGMLEYRGDEPLLNQMLYADTKSWLPDDLLVKADKMTMANSIELRVPLLDHVVLDYAASLPPEFKVRGRETKRVLKAAFAKVLPPEILQRKKAGFPVPYETWLRNRLNRKVEEVLLSSPARSRGYFEKHAVERLLKKNSLNDRYGKEIFSLLTLELWHREFLDQKPAKQSLAFEPLSPIKSAA
ncbi:MAG TPA: asparagine synthase (glutamine-hydrolyzing) [Verrucomicrobiae bacterium]|nr:asparagine synthase (glutamine-hydrolyzing) [Verrucomicrobiae bacterium]